MNFEEEWRNIKGIDLAKKYNVSRTTISVIKTGKRGRRLTVSNKKEVE